jgi:hypothetical protein
MTHTAQTKVLLITRLGIIGYLAKNPSHTPQPINNSPPTTSKAIILGFLYPPSALYTRVNGARIQAKANPIRSKPNPLISDMVCLKAANRDLLTGDSPSRICCRAYVEDASDRAESQYSLKRRGGEHTTQLLCSVITPEKDNHRRGNTNRNKNRKHPITPPPAISASIRIDALRNRSSEETIDDIRCGNSSLDSSSPLKRCDIGNDDSIHYSSAWS